MTRVLASTEDVPGLADAIARRRETGHDTYDEWWQGVYRVVTGPSPEHGKVAIRLGTFLDAVATKLGLEVAAPVNIGTDGVDAQVPDLAVYRPDTPRSSPAFLATAVLVVEILSPKEVPGEKLDFYAAADVDEYLELDLRARTIRLLVRDGAAWSPSAASPALGFTVTGTGLDAGGRRYDVDRPATAP